MTITDWIGVASIAAVTAYTLTAGWKAIQNTRASRNLTPGPQDSAVIRYSDFQKADATACCTIMTAAVNSWMLPYLEMSFSGRVITKVYVNYCPQCGRKLKK
jgi:hypothetical protein